MRHTRRPATAIVALYCLALAYGIVLLERLAVDDRLEPWGTTQVLIPLAVAAGTIIGRRTPDPRRDP